MSEVVNKAREFFQDSATSVAGIAGQAASSLKSLIKTRSKNYNGHELTVGTQTASSEKADGQRTKADFEAAAKVSLSRLPGFKLLPSSVKSRMITLVAQQAFEKHQAVQEKHEAMERTWLRGSKEEIKQQKEQQLAALSPEQQKLSTRIEQFKKNVASGIESEAGVREKQEEFKNKLYVLLNTSGNSSSQYKTKTLSEIKNLSKIYETGRLESLKLAGVAHNVAAKVTERNLNFFAGIQSLQASKSLPAALGSVDFNEKVKILKKNQGEIAELGKAVTADNALEMVSRLDRLKPKSFDDQCAMLDLISKELIEGKAKHEVSQIKANIRVLKTYIDPSADENISDARASEAFGELKFYLQRDEVPGKVQELNVFIKNNQQRADLGEQDKKVLQDISSALVKIDASRINTKQGLEEINQQLNGYHNQISALVMESIIL